MGVHYIQVIQDGIMRIKSQVDELITRKTHMARCQLQFTNSIEFHTSMSQQQNRIERNVHICI